MSRPRMTPELAAENARKDFQIAVKHRRVDLDLSQRELGAAIGISAPLMSELLADPDKLSIGRLRGLIRTLSLHPATILRLLGFSDKELRSYGFGDCLEVSGTVLRLRN